MHSRSVSSKPTKNKKIKINTINLYEPLIDFTNIESYSPENLAKQHISSGQPTTNIVINNLLLNQQVSISEADFNKIINIPYVEFILPINPQNLNTFTDLVGNSKSKGLFEGVYVFTHKESGRMYVGSTNCL